MDFGFRAVVAPSYADIFFNNCFKNGLLPVVLEAGVVDLLFHEVLAEPGYRLTIDLPQQVVLTPSGKRYSFNVDAFRKHSLVNGLDEIGLTLAHADEIRAFEAKRRAEQPWLFG
jgi:3-isopropylmalate/(R)-2-methylmalate dehydratase small subunit